MTEPTPTPALLKKLAAIMADCKYIQKDKENKFHGYWYASEQAIKEHVQPLLVKHGVLFAPTIVARERYETTNAKDKRELMETITMIYRFYDIDDGACLTGEYIGAGIDNGDKSIYKAITGCIKYILTSVFLIPTGDDPEDEKPEKETKEKPKTTAPTTIKAATPAAPAIPTGNAPMQFISVEQAQKLAMRFRDSLAENLKANADTIRHDWLVAKGFVDDDGKTGTAKRIPLAKFAEVGREAVEFARGLK